DHGTSMGERGLWWKHHLYEESVGVPLVAAGPGFVQGARVEHPVSLTSLYPTVLAALGLEDGRPGRRSQPLSSDQEPDLLGGFAEYHGLGASSAAFMMRRGPYKLVHFATADPQLFDLESDPGERVDLARDPAHAEVLAELTADLHLVVDPQAVDDQARAEQARLIELHGGRDAILSGGFRVPFTPPPAGSP
ncbi:MAG: sulfatase/phosphatase domain-containing protein, partial [Pedococcus sp.]